jgi:2-(1,2-epoxy-1,2-dihydrophenyl)acetyl-CoA isomerase
MLIDWEHALRECQADDTIHVVVVTGAGRAFCSGADTSDLAQRKEQTPLQRKAEATDYVHRIPRALLEMDKPVLAAVNGAAMGPGMDFALMCDLRYAAESARFGATYIRVGLLPGAGGCWLLPRHVGVAKALELLWTGDVVDAREAERIGIVNKVVRDDQLMTSVYEAAKRIADSAPLAVRFLKRALYQGLNMDLRSHLDQVSSHLAVVAASADHQEALLALKEKRKPSFMGR